MKTKHDFHNFNFNVRICNSDSLTFKEALKAWFFHESPTGFSHEPALSERQPKTRRKTRMTARANISNSLLDNIAIASEFESIYPKAGMLKENQGISVCKWS